MVYKRFVEIGRVALVNSGKHNGKLVVIADIVDQKRLLVENPVHGVPRHVLRTQNINLTSIKINIPVGARAAILKKKYVEENVDSSWEKTSWAKRLVARETKKNLTDFDRFKAARSKMIVNRKVKKVLKSMK